MPVSLEKTHFTSEEDTMVRWGIKIIVGIVTVVGLGWMCLYLVFSPSLWKTVIGEVRAPNGHTLDVGRAHDGDISYNYYVRVTGAKDEKLENWTWVAWSLNPTDSCVTAITSDSRFAGIEFKSEDGSKLVIYDTQDKELWWNADDQWASTTKFINAWRILHARNNRISVAP